MTTTLRDILPEDEPLLLQIYASTRATEMAQVPWSDEQRDAFLRMQFLAQHDYYQKQFPHADYKIIVSDGAPIGRLYVLRLADQMRILDIALLPEHRHSGIGSSLIKDLMDEGKKVQKPVRIYVESFNPAMPLFSDLGFLPISEEGFNHLLEWRPKAG